MVRNKLATAVLMISALQAGLASALGLGDINLKSALNQPLDAEIRLLDTGNLDPNQVVVRLASAADFERVGVARDFFLTNLRFDVQMDGRGSGVVRITTREAVIEPYLNFLLEARWPNGRLMREYTVLMDMPTFSDSAAVLPAPTATATGRSTAAPAAESGRTTGQAAGSSAAARPGAARTQMPEAADASEYRVQHNDTMYEIAARFRSGDASVQQTMLAIQQINPQAFINGNVNLVKSGYVLRMPSPEQARGISQEQAQAELASQNRAWRSGTTAGSGDAPQLDGRDGGDTGEAGAQSEARLSIAASGDSDRAAAGEGTGTGTAGLSALRDELASSQENLDKTRRDNEELQSRLSDMERQIATLQRLIELKDDQLAALQARAGAEDPADTGTDTAASEAPVDFNYADSDTEQANDTAAAAVPPAAAPQESTPPPKPGLLERLTSNWLYLGGLLAALVLALVAVLAARRRKAEADEAQDDVVFRHDDRNDPSGADDQDELALDDDEQLELDEAAFEDVSAESETDPVPASGDAPGYTETAPMAVAANTAAAVAASQPVRAETGDALAEADIYIAYGRYQQAGDLLLSAIRSEPERTDLRVKLLEVYVESRDKNAFQEHFLALSAMGDDDAVAQVKEFMSSVDGVSGWLDDLPAVSVAAVTAAAVEDGNALELDDGLDDGLDLDGGLDLEGDGDEQRFADAETDAEEVEGFDFDLELDTLDGTSNLDLEETGLDDLSSATAAAAGIGMGDLEADIDANSEAGLELELETLGDTGIEYRPVDADRNAAADLDSDPVSKLDLVDSGSDELDADLDDLDFALDSDLVDSGTDSGPAGEERALELDGLADGLALDNVSRENDDAFDLSLAGSADLSDLDIDFDPQSGSAQAADTDTDEALDLDSVSIELDAELDAEAEQAPAIADSAPAFLDTSSTGVPSTDAHIGEALPGEAQFEDPLDVVFDADDIDDEQDDEGFDFLGDTDEIATRLDLARAYIDMGDADGARDILEEVVQDGDDTQRQDAEELLARL